MFSEIFDEVVVFIRYFFYLICTLEKDSSQELREDFIVGASHHILHHKYILELDPFIWIGIILRNLQFAERTSPV
jgi:hypothetical protein